MKRTYDYDEFVTARRAAAARRMATLAQSRGAGAARVRPRTAEEREAITRAALAHIERRRSTGGIIEIAPRLYELR